MQNNIQNLAMQNPMNRPKKRSKDTQNWKRMKIKEGRVKGKLYIDYKSQTVPAKLRKETHCRCHPECTDLFTQQEKDTIFADFYGLSSHQEQTLYLRGCVVKTKAANDAYSNHYYLRSADKCVLVCQKFFLGLLGIKRSRLRCKVLNNAVTVADLRGQHGNQRKIMTEAIEAVRLFLHNLDARESHYSRQDNRYRKYLDSHKEIASLYQDFISAHVEYGPFQVRNINEAPSHVKPWIFEKIFNYEFNIGFGYPRSDICSSCEENKVEQLAAASANDQLKITQLKNNHEIHLAQAQEFYKSMSKETTDTLADDIACICFDFEKNLPLPVTNVTSEFFSRQLWIYNFGVHDIRRGATHMYMYSESFCHKGPNEVISALNHYLHNILPNSIRKLKLFCDNSSGQNKNRYLIAFLSTLHDKFEEIELLFPVVGHSRMPCDRDFAQIEKRKNKHDKFNFPSDWTNLIRKAQTSLPFHIVFLEHPLTDDLCPDETPIVKCLDFKSVMDPLVAAPTGIMSRKSFHFDRNGAVMSRVSTSGNFNVPFPVLKPTVTMNVLKQNANLCPAAYHAYIPLKNTKFNNIQALLRNIFIPDAKIFYESLTPDVGSELSPNELQEILDLLDEE